MRMLPNNFDWLSSTHQRTQRWLSKAFISSESTRCLPRFPANHSQGQIRKCFEVNFRVELPEGRKPLIDQIVYRGRANTRRRQRLLCICSHSNQLRRERRQSNLSDVCVQSFFVVDYFQRGMAATFSRQSPGEHLIYFR